MPEGLNNQIQQLIERPFGRFFLFTDSELAALPQDEAFERSRSFYEKYKENIHSVNVLIIRLEVEDDDEKQLKPPNYMTVEESEKPRYDRTILLGLKVLGGGEQFHWQLYAGGKQLDLVVDQTNGTSLMKRDFDSQGRLLREAKYTDPTDHQFAEAIIWKMVEHESFRETIEGYSANRSRHELAAAALREKKELSQRDKKNLAGEEKMIRSIGFNVLWIRDKYGEPVIRR